MQSPFRAKFNSLLEKQCIPFLNKCINPFPFQCLRANVAAKFIDHIQNYSINDVIWNRTDPLAIIHLRAKDEI